MKNPVFPLLEIADIHAHRLRYAMRCLKSKMPASAETMACMVDEAVFPFELYASRFAKLQDYMGTTLFDALLTANGEQIESMSFIDKLNKLEKLELIPSAAEWREMREIRNKLSHEYPGHPEIMANLFNQAYMFGPMLLACLENVTQFLKRLTL